MTELLDGSASTWSVLVPALALAALFGFVPGFLLRMVVLLYPRDDPRRRELVAELYVLGRAERMVWVFEQFETALSEGVPARLKQRRDRLRGEEETDDPTQEVATAGVVTPREADEGEAAKRHRFFMYATAVAMGPRVLGSHTG